MAGANPEQFAEMCRLRKINRTLGSLYLRTFLNERMERRNLSLMIEDDIVQHLVGARLKLSLWKNTENPPRTEFDELEEYLVTAIEAARRTTEKLFPSVLEVAGLESALQELCQKKSRLFHAACKIDASNVDACLTDKASRIIAYGIVCRLLEGFLDLQSADTIWIWLNSRENSIQIVIEDNSHDFDIQDITRPDEFPDIPFLVSLNEEIGCLNGKMRIERTSDIRVTTITLPHVAGCLEY